MVENFLNLKSDLNIQVHELISHSIISIQDNLLKDTV